MSSNIQTASPSESYFLTPQLPITDPYGLYTSYLDINNVNGVAGEVVDWIQVEIWRIDNWNGNIRTVLQSKALILKPDGSVVDVDGQAPVFSPQSGDVRVIVKHRNHLGVMSVPISNFTGTVDCNFNSATQADKRYPTDTSQSFWLGKWCLVAGDLNNDCIVDSTDYGLLITDYLTQRWGEYMNTDFNMDGIVDSTDYAYVIQAFQSQYISTLLNFEN